MVSVDFLPLIPDGILGVAPLPMRQLGEPLHEVWCGDDVHFGTFSTDDDDDIERAAFDAYGAILRTTREQGFPHLLRVWNHVRDINRGDGDEERYKRFCAGRHDAFRDAGWTNDRLPAASAVGIRRRGLVIYYLGSKSPGRQVENPRQVSAYDYPPEHGRRSPSFARATVFGDAVFLAGTASIVGHATVHAGNALAQLDETLTNVEAITRAAGCRGLESLTHVKVYLRNGGAADVAKGVRAAMPNAKVMLLEADICRRDLLLEIEAVGRV